ncbi:MAG: winged helix-turn-helix transcriptional regulator [Solirubrobacterales bacterium]|nr:winged helix-turn-helix transcriptional regulator [Solirubrobacterales bacterium]MBV9425509.1 winged helix-turn-helix transcriptional regulator [Solirubrobacterales bacterium]
MSEPVPACREHVGFLLRLAYQRASANVSDAISAMDLTPMQFQTLRRLHERGQMTQNELGRSVGMPPANIHATVQRLLARGLVRREPSAIDRRVTLVTLSTTGHRTFVSVLPAADAANARTLSVLSPDEQDTIMDLLWRIATEPDTDQSR